jgi:hypothetical protein
VTGPGAEEVRRLVLGPPAATEQDHRGRPSFRVAGKIFATLWTPAALNVMAEEDVILAAAEEHPGSCGAAGQAARRAPPRRLTPWIS